MKALVSAAALALALASAPAIATTIDFDTSPGGPVANGSRVDTQYASLGVTFGLLENNVAVGTGALASSDFGGTGTGNALWNTVGGVFPQDSDNRTDILRITFNGLANGVSFVTVGDGDLTQFNAYDAVGTLLETQANLTGGFASIVFATGGIARIDALQSIDNFTYRIDNLSFNLTAVPEPGTWAMMIGGFALAGAAMRRKSATTVRFA